VPGRARGRGRPFFRGLFPPPRSPGCAATGLVGAGRGMMPGDGYFDLCGPVPGEPVVVRCRLFDIEGGDRSTQRAVRVTINLRPFGGLSQL